MIRVFLSVAVGVYATYILINCLVPSVLASATIGLLASMTLHPKWKKMPTDIAPAIYCGSFIGMGSVLSVSQLGIASIVATGLILLSTDIFKGYGGKLGFTAYVSSIFTAICIALYNRDFDIYDVFSGFEPISDASSIVFVCLAVIMGFYSTTYIHHKLGKSSIFASAFPSFIVGLLSYANAGLDIFIATFFSASFAGMLASTLLSSRKYPLIVLALILITILFKSMLGSYGGSLGTMAFFSVGFLVVFNGKSCVENN